MNLMVRPENCINLVGASPVAVSADAPRSRLRAREEIPSSEWSVKGPQEVVKLPGGKQIRRPSEERTLQPRDIKTRKVGPAEPLMSRRRQQTPHAIGAGEDARGVWRRACGQRWMWNRRDPSWRPTLGEGGPYKPMAKGERAGRESEGFVVPLTPVTKTPVEGRDPALIAATHGGKRKGMVERPNNPIAKARKLRCRRHMSAERRRQHRLRAMYQSSGVTNRRRHGRRGCYWEACMLHVKIIGKPYAGNPHVRFERGPQETELKRHRA